MTKITEKNYRQEVEQAQLPVLLEFTTPKAVTCREFSPVFEALEKEYPHRFKFCRVELEEEKALAQRFRISHVPATVLLEKGVISQRLRGLYDKKDLMKILNLD